MNIQNWNPNNKPFVIVREAVRGWVSTILVFDDGEWDAWQTSIMDYATQAEADQDAKQWAECEEVLLDPEVAARLDVPFDQFYHE